jgi:alpha-L-rhamnosidase
MAIYWIAAPEMKRGYETDTHENAPLFRREFEIIKPFCSARIYICGLGYYELYLNGQKVGEHVLEPAPSNYLTRVNYTVYDVSEQLHPGCNTIGVILGNGWYNPNTKDEWCFWAAQWRDCPKLALKLELDGQEILQADESWRVGKSPIIFNALRNGEFYDARLEQPGWCANGFDDNAWVPAMRIAPPGGELEEQLQPPCKILATHIAQPTGKHDVYDAGYNLAGWARIYVEGEVGAEVILRYAERLTDDGALSTEYQDMYIHSGEFQTDRYILRGDGLEIWEPRFTYHGFRYIEAKIQGKATIHKIEARQVGTAFDAIGEITTADTTLNCLQTMTLNSYRANFVGIPTDCPHREKSGWTCDVMLAADAGLYNFDAATSYRGWLRMLADLQRKSGQLPALAPTGGFGYNWGSGPAWDSVLFVLPYDIYLHTGDDSAIREHYDGMKRYLDYCESMATDHLLSFGLGDWCPPDWNKMCPAEITSTGYYYKDAKYLALFAQLLGHTDDAQRYAALAEEIAHAFHQKFYLGDGRYGSGNGLGEYTASGCALYHGIVPECEREASLNFLFDYAQKTNCVCDFGILGAKYIPRVLAENGHADLALRLFTHREFPGWAHWIEMGFTTLGEMWDGTSSRNHIMYGDVSAWLYRYLGGFRHSWTHPGRRYLEIRPMPVIASCRAEYCQYVSDWRRDGDKFAITVTVPQDGEALLVLPNGSHHHLSAGTAHYQCACSSQKL